MMTFANVHLTKKHHQQKSLDILTLTNRCRPTHNNVRKSHKTLTVTRPQEDNQSKATSSLFPINMTAKLEGHRH